MFSQFPQALPLPDSFGNTPWLDAFLPDAFLPLGEDVTMPDCLHAASQQPSSNSGSSQMNAHFCSGLEEVIDRKMAGGKAAKAVKNPTPPAAERRRHVTNSLASQLVEAQERLQQHTATYAAALAENQRLCDRANVLESACSAREAHSLFMARLQPVGRVAPGLAPEVQQQLRSSALPRPLQRRLAPAASESQISSAELTFLPLPAAPILDARGAGSSSSLCSSGTTCDGGSGLVASEPEQTAAQMKARCLGLASTSLTGRGPEFEDKDIAAFKSATPEHFKAYWVNGLKDLSIELIRASSHPASGAGGGGGGGGQLQGAGGAGGASASRIERLAALVHGLLSAANTIYSINPNAILDCCGMNMDTVTKEEPPAGHWRDVVRACAFDKDQLRQVASAVALMQEQLAPLEREHSLLINAATGAAATDSRSNRVQISLAVDALVASGRRVQSVHQTAFGFLFSPRLLSVVQMAQLLASSWPFMVDPAAVMYSAMDLMEDP